MNEEGLAFERFAKTNLVKDYLFKPFETKCDVKLGVEIELLLLKAYPFFSMGNNKPIFMNLIENHNWLPISYSDTTLSGVYEPITNFCLVTEAGKGTIECNLPPCDGIYEMFELLQKIMPTVISVVEEEGQYLIGYGISPNVLPKQIDYLSWFPMKRYHLLRELLMNNPKCEFPKELLFADKMFKNFFEQGVNNVTITACVQPHYRVKTSQEAIIALDVWHVLTPMLIALFRNSPVYGNQLGTVFASRQALWSAVHNEQAGLRKFGRYLNEEGLIRRFLQATCFFDGENGNFLNQTLKELSIGKFTTNNFSLIGKTLWDEVRLTQIPTIEVRPVCQQLPGKTFETSWLPMLEVVAFVTGVMANLNEVHNLINQLQISDAKVIDWYWSAQKPILNTLMVDDKFVLLFKQTLCLAYEGLQKRGVGEEKYFENKLFSLMNGKLSSYELFIQQLSNCESAETFRKGGLFALFNRARFKKS